MLASSIVGLWTYLFGVSNLKYDSTYSLAPKSLRLDYDGNCALFDRLQNCAQLSTEKRKATELLISDIRSNILWDQSFTDDQRMVFTYEKLHGFYVRYPQWLDNCTMIGDRRRLSIQQFIKAAKLVSFYLCLIGLYFFKRRIWLFLSLVEKTRVSLLFYFLVQTNAQLKKSVRRKSFSTR